MDYIWIIVEILAFELEFHIFYYSVRIFIQM